MLIDTSFELLRSKIQYFSGKNLSGNRIRQIWKEYSKDIYLLLLLNQFYLTWKVFLSVNGKQTFLWEACEPNNKCQVQIPYGNQLGFILDSLQDANGNGEFPHSGTGSFPVTRREVQNLLSETSLAPLYPSNRLCCLQWTHPGMGTPWHGHTLLSPVSPPHPKTWSQMPAFHRKPQTKESISVIVPCKLTWHLKKGKKVKC